jgi:hypothetical protein
MKRRNRFILISAACLAVGGGNLMARAADPLSWPVITSQNRPWAYWWWMGSAVDQTNITRELERYHAAGLGGVHIIPIYGAKGWESNYISYLSPRWMAMMGHSVAEGRRLGLGVDMTTGTGWCFGGGPNVGEHEGNASVVVKTYDVAAGETLPGQFDRQTVQALMAFFPDGKSMDLTGLINTNGSVLFSPKAGPARVYEVSQKLSGQKVKRAAPGGEGPMLNLFYPEAMTRYLDWFDQAFAHYTGPKPRAQYHDSYEYKSDWSPDFFAQFEKRRGYKLQAELPALFGSETNEHVARVKCDYRETVSDIMAEETLPQWVKWSHAHGFLTRNEAHGSPGNLLDLYAAADIPETEFFRDKRNPLVAKFASSAAHVTGKELVAAETGTWLKEHFTETLADMKYLVDDFFLSGVNHVFYHGTCYSPDEAGWPGWVFYASTEMNPRNPIWRDVPALNAYIARCQAVLQSGRPDNDILLYWPIYDLWHNPAGRLSPLQVESGDKWLLGQPVGQTAKELWDNGYAFDYVSDAQLKMAQVANLPIRMPGGREYGVILVPKCKHLPLETFKQLLALARQGAYVVFEEQLPNDIPGLSNADKREEFKRLTAQISFRPVWGVRGKAEMAHVGKGVFVKGDLKPALLAAAVGPQSALAFSGLKFVRRVSYLDGWKYLDYFIANRSGTNFDGWIHFGLGEKSAVLLDPMTGTTGIAASRQNQIVTNITEIHLQLLAGESVILRTLGYKIAEGPAWTYWQTNGQPMEISGDWKVKFIEGGPVLPASFATTNLASWTGLGGTNAQSFAGTARYSITFDAPGMDAGHWRLDLGKVCQSARVTLNGQDYGTLIAPPFQVTVDSLKSKDNLLEIEVTSTAANRIRDLDRRGVLWKNFRDINFVNQNYKPFDASDWPLQDSGLLGPVTVAAVSPAPVPAAD